MGRTCSLSNLLIERAKTREQAYDLVKRQTPGSPRLHELVRDLGHACRAVASTLALVANHSEACACCAWLVQSVTPPEILIGAMQQHVSFGPDADGGVK